EACFSEALAGLLGEMAEQSFHISHVGGVFAEGVIVRDGFGFGVDEEFVSVSAASLAVKCGAPLAEDFFKFFLRVRSELLNSFDAEGAKGAFGDFADTGNFADGKRSEEASLHTWGYPD